MLTSTADGGLRADPFPADADSARSGALVAGAMLACFSLWDFYIGEIRLLDFGGLALGITLAFALAVARQPPTLRIDRSLTYSALLLFALIFAYALIGIAQQPDNLKPSVGLVLGFLVLAVLRLLSLDRRRMVVWINLVALVHLGALLLQMTYYYSTHEVLNFHAVVGLQPRLVSSVFRPAGLFLEPAIYCFFSASLFLLRRQMQVRVAALDYLLLVSMAMSLSMWGIAVAAALLLLFRPALAIPALVLLVVAAVVTIQATEFDKNPVYVLFESRLSDLSSDASTQQRYAGSFRFFATILSDPVILFGSGINNAFEERGTNGLSFIINSMGLFGLSLLVSLLMLLAPIRNWLTFAAGLLILLTAAPLWKTLYFWLWIALMLHPMDGDDAATER